jgi:hypothetical protein
MIVGYLDNNGDAVCAACWPARAEAGAWPLLILDSEDPLDPEHNFWVVDECTQCGGRVEYLTVVAVN